jgi:hypothetical protein
MNNIKIISLGGVGGCDLATALRNMNQLTHPYDWLVTTQSFVLRSFNNFENFFTFDEKYSYHNDTYFIDKDKKAVMPHDFTGNFNLEKDKVISKYKRRFERLNENLNSDEDILFVRIYDNLEEHLIPNNFYDNIFDRDEEDIEKWDEFISHTQKKYNKKIKLLIISSKENIVKKQYSNVIVYFTKQHKYNNIIHQIIEHVLTTIF